MDASFRSMLIAAGAITIALIIFFPNHALLIIVIWLIAQAFFTRICLQKVEEPDRPIILRMGIIHRLGPSGVFFIVPWVDTLGDRVSMKPEYQEFTITQLHASDGEGVYMNLEITWRLRPDIARIDDAIKRMLLVTVEQRRKFVEQGVNVVARQLIHGYASDQLKRPTTREEVSGILKSAVNEYFAENGLIIDSIFWRGTNPAKEVNEAKLRVKVSHEQVKGMVADMELVRQRFPEIPAEEFLAYQAWLELIRRGISPPGIPNSPMFPNLPPMPKLP